MQTKIVNKTTKTEAKTKIIKPSNHDFMHKMLLECVESILNSEKMYFCELAHDFFFEWVV